MENSVWPQEEMMMRLRRRMFIILTGPREGSQHAMQGHRGRARTWSGGRRQDWGESLGHSHYWWFHRQCQAGQGREFRFGLFGSFQQVLDGSAIPDYLTPGAEGKEILAWSVRVRQEVVGTRDSGLVGLYMRKVLSVEPSINKVLEAAVSSQPASFLKCQNVIKHRK